MNWDLNAQSAYLCATLIWAWRAKIHRRILNHNLFLCARKDRDLRSHKNKEENEKEIVGRHEATSALWNQIIRNTYRIVQRDQVCCNRRGRAFPTRTRYDRLEELNWDSLGTSTLYSHQTWNKYQGERAYLTLPLIESLSHYSPVKMKSGDVWPAEPSIISNTGNVGWLIWTW